MASRVSAHILTRLAAGLILTRPAHRLAPIGARTRVCARQLCLN